MTKMKKVMMIARNNRICSIITLFWLLSVAVPATETLTPLECGTEYTASDMRANGCSSTLRCYTAGISTDGRFESIGDGTSTSPYYATVSGTSTSYGKSCYSKAQFSSQSVLSDGVPTTEAIRFTIDKKGVLTVLTNNSAQFSVLCSATKEILAFDRAITKADSVKLNLSTIGDYYIYNSTGSIGSIYSIQLDECEELEDGGAMMLNSNNDITIYACSEDPILYVYVYDGSGNLLESYNYTTTGGSEKVSVTAKADACAKIVAYTTKKKKTWTF